MNNVSYLHKIKKIILNQVKGDSQYEEICRIFSSYLSLDTYVPTYLYELTNYQLIYIYT